MDNNNWKQVGFHDKIMKWQYSDSPYRLVAHINDRGHWEVLFTSTFYKSQSVLVRGNLGGGNVGRMKAKVIAKKFAEKYPYGCPPPNKIKDYKI